ncbi:MAG TPA: acetyl-CoA carboxylase biotin carboxylase subunit [Candidatus Acidoferrales bacterium]|nr:acetyl-CoA carboxylase biotin carboxylase subunit [Candidatus Acidoferrales bacterium]
MFRKILIANRGEIAVRILRACREMNIRSVAVFSDVDRAALHVRLADEAYHIGPAASRESYLAIDKIISIARRSGCGAVHPGYGFLAENPEFARASAAAGIAFIGPSAEAMEMLGSKTEARHVAKRVGVPTVPGTLDPIGSLDEALRTSREIGFPVVLKAVAGGGGKGMRLIERESDLQAGWRDAASEAKNAFGDERLYLEKYLLRPRHVEIQILGDQHGAMVYLGERECSIQRRHQKVIEEAPSPIMTPELRRAMGEAAIRLAREGGYTNAGTVEFLVDDARNFYFLEVNTRLQVEHPVTEMTTSLDLVKLQFRIAAGEKLPFGQRDVAFRGHAIECRIYAEDPDNNFFPSPGKIVERRVPTGPGVRLDEGVYAGWTVPNEYDPLLGKLIAWGADRAEAIARLRGALDEYYATGIRTNVGLLRRILVSADFEDARIHTRWLDEALEAGQRPQAKPEGREEPQWEKAAAIAAAMWHMSKNRSQRDGNHGGDEAGASRWRVEGRSEQVSREPREK